MSSPALPTLRTRPLQEVLHVANMRVALLAVTLASFFLFVLGLFMLRFYMLDNLHLSARSVAYTVEAAVVFGDAAAAAEDLRSITANRSLAAAYVLAHAGKVIAHWEELDDSLGMSVSACLRGCSSISLRWRKYGMAADWSARYDCMVPGMICCASFWWLLPVAFSRSGRASGSLRACRGGTVRKLSVLCADWPR